MASGRPEVNGSNLANKGIAGGLTTHGPVATKGAGAGTDKELKSAVLVAELSSWNMVWSRVRLVEP